MPTPEALEQTAKIHTRTGLREEGVLRSRALHGA